MSRKKRMQNVREAKDRRAKKIAIGGGVLLAVLLAWEVPHYLGGKKSSAAPAPTPAASTTPSGTTPATTTPATTATGVPAAASTPATSTKLPNSDMPPRHSKQQLAGFSTFADKDPFIQQISADAGTGATVTSSTTAPTSSTTSRNKIVLTGRTLAHSGAVRISVNGRPESVRVGASFPRSNPVFRLVSVTRAGVRIGIANGSYSSGAQTVSLGFSRMVTLVDTANGARYKLQLLGS
jgi:hypothetical protein